MTDLDDALALAVTEANKIEEALLRCQQNYTALQTEYETYKAQYPPVTTPPDQPPDQSGWSLFTQTAFTSLAPFLAYDNQTQGNDNSVNLKKNVLVNQPGLILIGKRETGYSRPFTSAEIHGKGVKELVLPNYFRAEVTGTFTDQSGIWPCLLWFRPNTGGDGSNGEIDVMEWMGGMWSGDQRRVAITMHNEYGATQDSAKKPLILRDNPWYDPNVEHTYTIEKVPGKISVWIDKRLICTFGPADKSWWNRIMEAKDRTWYPRITLQIGSGATTQVVPNPPSTWTQTQVKVKSYKTWKQA